MLILHVKSSRFRLYLLNIYHIAYTFSHAHTEAHTHKHTCIEEWRQPGTGAWLRGADMRRLLETKALHTHKRKKEIKKKCQENRIFTNLKKFEHTELPAKLLDYFLRTNKSNINQYLY